MLDLTIGVLGKTNGSRLGETLEPRGDIDAVAHEIAVALLNNVAEVNADAKVNALFGRQTHVALDHAGLHLDRAAHRIDHAAELDDRAVAGALDDAAVVKRDGWVDEVAAKRPQARKRPFLVGAGEPAVSDDIRNQDRRELSGLAHCAPPAGGRASRKGRLCPRKLRPR